MSLASEDTVPITFNPPMWEQRRNKVKEILAEESVKEFCDLGCGSGGLISEMLYFKGIKTLIGIDIDQESLDIALENCSPGIPAYIVKRKSPLEVLIIKGSILEKCSLIPFQIDAVTLCEV